MKKIAIAGISLFSALFIGAGQALADGTNIYVMNAWVREAPPTAQTLAAYMMVSNQGDKERILKGAESPLFGKVELHRTVHKNNIAMMIAQPEIKIPPRGKLEMTPGDYHVMLIAPQEVLKAGMDVPLTLHFANGEAVKLDIRVRKAKSSDMHHGNHSMMKNSAGHDMKHGNDAHEMKEKHGMKHDDDAGHEMKEKHGMKHDDDDDHEMKEKHGMGHDDDDDHEMKEKHGMKH